MLKTSSGQYILNPPMNRPAVLAVFACATSVIAAQPPPQRAGTIDPHFASIAQLVRDAIADHQLPGAVVLIGRGDAVLYAQAFGDRAVLPTREPMTLDTIFDLASLTKVVATT